MAPRAPLRHVVSTRIWLRLYRLYTPHWPLASLGAVGAHAYDCDRPAVAICPEGSTLGSNNQGLDFRPNPIHVTSQLPFGPFQTVQSCRPVPLGCFSVRQTNLGCSPARQRASRQSRPAVVLAGRSCPRRQVRFQGSGSASHSARFPRLAMREPDRLGLALVILKYSFRSTRLALHAL